MTKRDYLARLSGLILGAFVLVGDVVLLWNIHNAMGYVLTSFTGLMAALQLVDMFHFMTHPDNYKEDDTTDESNTTVDP